MTPPQRKEARPVAALLAPDIVDLLEESPADVAAETEEMHPADLADVAEAIPREMVAALLNALPKDRAADVLEYMDEELRAEVLEEMTAKQAASLVSAMTPDDRADVLEELAEEHAEDILADMPTAARQETERLLAYDPESAGGLMTTEFVAVAETLSVEAALAAVRTIARAGRSEAMHSIYATDTEGRVAGVFSLRELLAAANGAKVSDIAWEEVVTVPPIADRAEVARVTREYDLVAVPVVDEQSRMLGVVTVDDVLDAMVDEQTEDVQKLGAVQPLDDTYFQTGFWNLARKRGGWLVLLFVEEMFTGVALRHYERVLASVTALMFFVPLIISSGGNSGSQSATLITRALAVGDVRLADTIRVLSREIGQGLVLGAFLGLIGFGRAMMWGNGYAIASVVALTLTGVVVVGTIVGALLPLIFTKVGFDPAIASSPFVASLVDVAGIILYFTIAIQLLGLR